MYPFFFAILDANVPQLALAKAAAQPHERFTALTAFASVEMTSSFVLAKYRASTGNAKRVLGLRPEQRRRSQAER